MRVSICIASRNNARLLENTLDSIFSQRPEFDFEVIVVNDGSSDETAKTLERYPLKSFSTDSQTYRNPSVPRNIAYRAARGEVIICQSDEVVHGDQDTISKLANELTENTFVIATVYNWNNTTPRESATQLYTGPARPRPLFFLGSVHRKHLYAIGGNEELFTSPGYEDDWFADCLTLGLKLKPHYSSSIIGYHQDHPRPPNLKRLVVPSYELYLSLSAGSYEKRLPYCSSGGPWQFTE